MSLQQTIVADGTTGVVRNVKNLGWLYRNAGRVKFIEVLACEDRTAFLTAYLTDGGVYFCHFADWNVAREWVESRSVARRNSRFAHCRVAYHDAYKGWHAHSEPFGPIIGAAH